MTDNEEELLERIAALTQENNTMLRKMHKMNRLSTIFRVVYWFFIIGAAIGLFYYFQPYIDSFMGIYQSLLRLFAQVQHFGQTATSTMP